MVFGDDFCPHRHDLSPRRTVTVGYPSRRDDRPDLSGAYGISNNVPLIGLGIALAYRFRNSPRLAGLGVALAAAPKASGLLMVVPFLVAGRIRTVGWTALWYGLVALIPLSFDSRVWSHYFKAGLTAVNDNAQRGDNGSLLHLGRSWGVPDVATVAVLAVIVCAVALLRRDLYWPLAWAVVATLPIAWVYSLLTFLPLIVWAVVRCPRRSAKSGHRGRRPHLGHDASRHMGNNSVFPIVTVTVLVLLITAKRGAPDQSLWLSTRLPIPVFLQHLGSPALE